MARSSDRNMTLTPLADRWDSSGRIVTPMTSAPVPDDTEKSMRLDSLKLSKTKQLDALETDKLTADIESFVTNPGGFKGASVRKADFGTREFEFGGRKIFTYSADAEQKDRASFTKLNDSKSFAELLTTDLPSRLTVASRLWTEGGDKAGAHAELAAVDSFVKDNYETLATLTKYQGTNPLAATVAKQASVMISGAYKLPFATMDRDPEIRAKSALKTATDTGLSGAAADLFVRKENGDAEAAALWGSLGAPSLDPKPGVSGKGVTPQAARASATGANITDIVDYSEYAAKSLPALRASLGEETFGMFSPSERASLVRESYTAGGAGAGQVLLDLAVGASSRLVGQEKVDAFKSAVSAGSTALQSWGVDDSDPARRTQGVKVLKALSDLPRGGLSAGKQQISDTLKAVARDTATYRNMGVALDDSTAETYAKVLYKRAFSPSEVLTGEEGRVSGVMNSAFATARNIVVGSGFTDTGKQPEAKGEFDLLAGVAKEHVQGAAAAAIANKTDLGTEMLNRSGALAQSLQALGVSDPVEADNGARLLAQVLSSGKEVDFSKLPELIGQSSLIRDLVGQANTKAVTEGKPSTRAADGDAVFARAMDKALKAEEAKDASAGVARTQEERVASAKALANSDPDVALVKNIENVDVRARDMVAGEGDKNAAVSGFVSAVASAVPKILLEASPVFSYLYTEVASSELSNPEVREVAIGKVMEAYKKEVPLAFAGSDKLRLQRFATERVDALLAGARKLVGEVGASNTLSLGDVLGKDKAKSALELSDYAKITVPPGTPTIGAFGAAPGYTPADDKSRAEVASDLATALSGVFFSDVSAAVPEGTRGFGVAAKTKIRNLMTLPQAAAEIPAPDIKFNIALTGGSDKVLSGYNALKTVSERLGKPIQNAAVRQLVLEDLPQLMRDMPSSTQMRGRRVALKMAYEGKTTDEIMSAFEASFTAEERRAAAAKLAMKAEEARMKAQAEGVSALGTAETAADQK